MLSLSLTLFIIIIIISFINAIWGKKKKQLGGRVVLLIKQCGHVYSCYLCTNFFGFFSFFYVCLFICFFLVENFYICFLEFNNCVCKFDKNKNKNLLKKNLKRKQPTYATLWDSAQLHDPSLNAVSFHVI